MKNAPVVTAREDDELSLVAHVLGMFDACEFGYGTMIPHAWIEDAFGLKRPQHNKLVTPRIYDEFRYDYMEAVDTLRDALLLERKMMLRSVKGKGYVVCEPADQTRVACADMVQSVRKSLTKCVDELTYINTALLNAEQVRENTDAKTKVATLARMANKPKYSSLYTPKPRGLGEK